MNDSIYLALTDLIGIDLSANEAIKAVQVISDRVFGRQFKIADDDSSTELAFDLDTLPHRKCIREEADKVEARSLAAEANKILLRSKEGNVITHFSDSTTKRGVGKFNVAGIHINKEVILPLPTIPVAGESKEEIVELRLSALGFQILDSGKEPGELFKLFDLFLTDSVSNNKFRS